MNVLFAIFEASPYIKTGGLGDIGETLPRLIKSSDYDISVIMPKHGGISNELLISLEKVTEFEFIMGSRKTYCGIFKTEFNGINYYLIDNEYYFNREKIYGDYDDGERMIYFSKAITEFIKHSAKFKPDIIHCNDWHTALVPVMVNVDKENGMLNKSIKTVLTVHNNKFQGIYNISLLNEFLDLASNSDAIDALIWKNNNINFLKGGIVSCDRLTTVSESYAKELCLEDYGEGLDWLYRLELSKFSGIMNGIDQKKYSPFYDKNIAKRYSANSFENKAICKAALQRELGFKEDKDVVFIGMVSRITEQKGFDIIIEIMNDLMKKDIQFVIVGTGEDYYERSFYIYSKAYKDKFAYRKEFDVRLSSRIYAGVDIFLVPSKFEPCGLTQMIAMKYGAVPIVRETGGLKDSVNPYNEYKDEGNGFSFKNYKAEELLKIIEYASSIFNDKRKWHNLIIRCMKSDFSWNNSISKYRKIYKEMVKNENSL